MNKIQNHSDEKSALQQLWIAFLTVTIPIVCVSGASFFPYTIRLPLIYMTGIVFVIMFVFSNIKLYFNSVTIPFALFLICIGISCFNSLDIDTSFNLFLIYLCAFTLLFIDIPQNALSRIITVIYVFAIVIAFSIIISVFINNCMTKYFWFIVNPGRSVEVTKAINKELAIGSFSGFAREKAEAAYIVNVGIAVSFSKYFSKGKLEKKDTFFLLVLLAALILTGKRTLFIIPTVCFAVFIMVAHIKGKLFRAASVIIIAGIGVIFIMMFVPEMANIFNRFLDQDSMESIGNRDELWKYIFMMISQYTLFGAGFGSYNEYAYQNGLRVYGAKWTYNAHNAYFQVLGELGVVGEIIFILFVISAFIFTIKLISKVKDDSSASRIAFFSLYIQILLLIYAVTGNPLYTKQIIFMWIFAIGAALQIKRPSSVRNIKGAIKYE